MAIGPTAEGRIVRIRKIEDVVLYSDGDYYCGPGPAVVVFPDGELTAVFRRHRSWTPLPLHKHVHPTTEMCLVRSADGGQTWSRARVFMGGGQCAVAGLMDDGTMLFVTHRQELIPEEMEERVPADKSRERLWERKWPTVSAGTEVWRSDNRGDDWDGPFWVDGVPDQPPMTEGLHPPLQLRGFPLQLQDGAVVLPLQAQEPLAGALLVASTDGGRSWSRRGAIYDFQPQGKPRGSEWSVMETPSGDLVGFVRGPGVGPPDGGWLWTCRSSDGGVTWSEMERLQVWGHPAHILRLPSGNNLLTYGYRRPPYGVRCRVLNPECDNANDAEELVLRDDGGGPDLGYPHSALLSNGRVMIVYYIHLRENGQRFIAGSIVEVD